MSFGSQGSSALTGYITLLLLKLHEEVYCSDWNIVIIALNTLCETYETCCKCLVLQLEETNGVVSTELNRADSRASADDSIDWFFDAQEVNELELNSLSTKNNPSHSPLGLEMLLEGLQHSLPWEYDCDQSYHSTMALPMLIAFESWKTLISKRSETDLISLRSSGNIDPMSANLENYLDVCTDQRALELSGIPRLISSIEMQVVHASSSSKYDIYTQSIVVFHDKIRDSAFDKSVDWYDRLAHLIKVREDRGFVRVVLVDSPIYIDDTTESGAYLEGSGASQQALDIQKDCVVVYSVASNSHLFTDSTERSDLKRTNMAAVEQESYLSRAIKHLQALDVHLLICVDPISSKLVDACCSHDIAVISCHKGAIYTMARLLNDVEVVEDILDLDNSCVACNHTVGIAIRDSIRTVDEEAGGTGVDISDKVMIVISPTPLGGCTFDDNTCTRKAGTNTEMSTTGQCHNNGFGHVSVILKAPTCILGRHLKDRVTRCLNRIDHAFHRRGEVMVGAGLVDVLCCIRLRQERYRLQSHKLVPTHLGTTLSNQQPHQGEAVDSSALCRLLECIEGVFEDFAYVVNTNNGVSPTDAMEQWHRSVQSLCAVMKCKCDSDKDIDHSREARDCAPGQWRKELMKLSWKQQCFDVEPPIRIGHGSVQGIAREESCSVGAEAMIGKPIVLDIKLVRVEAMRTAVYVVKSILGAAATVSNASTSRSL